MRFNKKITLAVLACASPFFTGCSDAPSKGELQEINDISNDRHLINKGVTNPKTLYVGNSEDVKIDTHEVVKKEIKHVVPQPVVIKEPVVVHKEVAVVSKKVVEVKKVVVAKVAPVASVAALSSTQALKLINQRDNALAIASQKDKNIAVIKKQRDEAIALSLSLKKDIDAKTIDLNHQIQGLKQNYNEKDSLAQDKLKALALTISSAKELTSANVSEIKHINLERDAALKKVDLLDAEIGKLKTELDNTKDLVGKKIDIIDGLKHERDDAVSLTLDIKKDIDAKTADLNQEIQGLKQNYSDNEVSVKTKVDELNKEIGELKVELDNSQKLLDDSKDLVEKKIDIIDGLTHERDDAVSLTLDIKKDIDSKTADLNQEIQGLKQNYSDNEVSVKTKVDELNKEIEKLKVELDNSQGLVDKNRDIIDSLKQEKNDAVSLTLALKNNIDKKTADLNQEIQGLKQNYSDNSASSKEKVVILNKEIERLKIELDSSQKLSDNSKGLVADKISIIESLKQERDDAVLLTLSLKKDIDAKTSDLSQEIQGLKQDYSDKGALEVEKLKSLTLELNKIKAQRDEAIKVTADMEKKSDEFEAQALELNKKIQSLSEVNTQKDSLTDEKIQLITADLDKANELIAKNATDAKLLINQRDDALKSLEDLNKDKAENESSSTSKIATAVAALTVAKQLTAKGQGEIDSLKEKLAQCDKALVSEKSARKDVEVKMLQSQKNSVINNIMSTFELSKVEFKTSSSILTNDSTKLLDRVAKIMSEHSNYQYKIQGHTDSQGKQESNLKLSDDRAVSVKDYLVSKGVDANILSSVGFGSSNPIADNKTSEGRSANRRVVFEILD